ncbi:Rieske (2Fe-2S) protein [Nakamurella antarctica]|uniref:Cytochrome bc1 complex Rieske iron-sulfur subunit n=2 Tax=Nakamurella antarctica TaxID=1902245 RepID=A0A3G8ZR27_9ACTN|nr:Rieske (2Fe-2S) protein [Nakamurella antarctica]
MSSTATFMSSTAASSAASSSAPASSTAASSAASSSAPASSGTSAAASGAPVDALTGVSAIPDGGSLVVKVGGEPIALARKGNDVLAFTAVCPHQQCTVGSAGATLQCPCHGSEFDAFTGAVLQGPAKVPLAAIPVKVQGDQVVRA